MIHSNGGKVHKIYQNMSEGKRERSIGFRERVALLGYHVSVFESLDAFEPEADCSYTLGTPSSQKYQLIEVLKKRYALDFSTLIHPTVHLGSNVHIGEGVTVDVGTVVAANLSFG